MWARSRLGEHFYLAKDEKNEFRIIGEKRLTRDGHCSFSPNRRWILTDTYPDKNRLSTLKVFNCEDGHELILGRFYSHPSYSGEIRCDLHPRWSRTGSKICFDSVHEGSRQMYVMDVRQLTEEGDPRHVL
jgi:hypothetical protein